MHKIYQGKMTKLSIIIPTYRRSLMLERCIESVLLQKRRHKNYEIIIISDGFDMETDSIVHKWKKNPQVIYLKKANGGPASARNRGLTAATGQIITFLDDDCIVSSDWISHILEAHEKNPSIGAISGSIRILNKNLISEYLYSFEPANYFQWRKNQNIKLSLVNNVSYKRDIVLSLKGFNKKLRTAEDVEWNYRMNMHGVTALYDNSIVVFHEYRDTFKGFMRQAFGFGHGRAYLFMRLSDYPEDRSNIFFYTLRFIIIPFISPWIRLYYGFSHKKRWWILYLPLGYLHQLAYWSGFIVGLFKSMFNSSK